MRLSVVLLNYLSNIANIVKCSKKMFVPKTVLVYTSVNCSVKIFGST